MMGWTSALKLTDPDMVDQLVFEYIRKLFVVKRTERYRVAVGEETFGRVLQFGRQYFDRQSIGRIDADFGAADDGFVEGEGAVFLQPFGIAAEELGTDDDAAVFVQPQRGDPADLDAGKHDRNAWRDAIGAGCGQLQMEGFLAEIGIWSLR